MASIRSFCALLALALAASAQPAVSVDDLMKFVESAISQHYPDKAVAQQVAKIKLANRLDDARIAELQRDGAQPKTVEALQQLAKASAGLPAAPVKIQTAVAPPPPPSSEEQARILDEIRENALNYSQNLPNYICSQITKRHIDPTGNGSWQLEDQVVEHLTYYEQKENYKVITINDRPVTTNMPHDKLPGAKSSGEFGSILREIFDPNTQTQFEWDHLGRLGPRIMYVFSFRVRQPRYGILHEDSKQQIHVGYHGLIYADRETKRVMRIKMDCDDIPPDFPIQNVSLLLDYDFAEISGKQFLLPSHSELRSREGRFAVWNETDFRLYNKYETNSSISFGDSDATDDKTPTKKK